MDRYDGCCWLLLVHDGHPLTAKATPAPSDDATVCVRLWALYEVTTRIYIPTNVCFEGFYIPTREHEPQTGHKRHRWRHWEFNEGAYIEGPKLVREQVPTNKRRCPWHGSLKAAPKIHGRIGIRWYLWRAWLCRAERASRGQDTDLLGATVSGLSWVPRLGPVKSH